MRYLKGSTLEGSTLEGNTLALVAWSVVVAGGAGIRFGSLKQFSSLGGHPVVFWSLKNALAVCQGAVVVVPAEFVDQFDTPPNTIVTAGGETRADSVRRGLAKVPDNVEIIVVHDAVRPLASVSLFKLVIEAVERGADGAIPGLAVTDTIKHQANNKVISTINREELVVSQTPQAFNASILRLAHQNQPEATDDASLVENCGGTVVVVPGEAKNIKITAPSDLKIAELLLGESEDGLE